MNRQQINAFAKIEPPLHMVCEQRIATLQAENERLTEAVSLARKRLCRYCGDENYEDRGPDSVGEAGAYWHWGIGTGKKPLCDAVDIRRAALAPEKEKV